MPTPLLRIVNWQAHFENNRTRELKRVSWVPIPNRQDGSGYCALLDHPDGPAHFGTWIALLEVASKCGDTAPSRGTLAKHVNGHSEPLSTADLARMTRIPKSVIEAAVVRLCEIGWLEQIPQEGATIPQEGAPRASRARAHVRREWNGTEGNGTEGNDPVPTEPLSRTKRDRSADLNAIFDHYRSYHPRARPGDKERRLALARLDEGYSPQDLIAAIDGNHRDPHCCGQNDRGAEYHDLALILRDSSHVARYIATPTNHVPASVADPQTVDALRRFVEKGDPHA